MALAKARDRRVIGHPVRSDHTVGDVLNTLTLDHPRRPLPPRIPIEQQRDHHRRIVRRPAMAIEAIDAKEPRQIHLLDRVQHKPRQMALRQPLPKARRQQQHLIAITLDEVLRHTDSLLNPPDVIPIYATATADMRSGPSACTTSAFDAT